MSISDKIAIASLIVTVVTLGIAIYALFTWKKQLKYNLIFDLEDKFDALLEDFLVEFNIAASMEYKLFINIENLTIEKDMRDIVNKISKEDEDLRNKKVNQNTLYDYKVSLNRAKRLFQNLEKDCKFIEFEYLSNLLIKIATKEKVIRDNSVSFENCLTEYGLKLQAEIINIQKEGSNFLTTYRKSL
ncbi:MAG: hypothetical protein RBR93_09290 [Aliarcobacter butzleri]|uniref:hypothetical protein n=1 Tax=Aliarcobacter butzleri TaxID=28197 RepID=UPI00263D247B|nr:hypothetical protein [Aliarcobacter butzleri]MDN5092697.1 hypothetical protein [Aliarcobacter butzleri]MDY0193710.1 hypothetical protein [Aliarcobacter butzleri]